jgi:uncharacterized protein YcbK (DUF882 family)
MALNELLCGQDGIFTQIKDAQLKAQQLYMQGKNVVDSIENTIDEIENIIDTIQNAPDVIVSRLQQEVLNIISVTALNNPEGALAQVLELRAKYQEAGPAVERVLDNVERFIEDPLNNPLDVCNDIPNIIEIGETFVEFPKKALQADPSKELENIKQTIVEEYLDIFDNPTTVSEELLEENFEQTIPTAAKYPVPDVTNDIILSGVVPIEQATNLGPGSAHQAAIVNAGKAATASAPATAGTSTAEVVATNKSTPPPPSLANPFPEGKQFVADDFKPSKYARNIASKINSLHPSIRGRFAAGVQDYIKNNFPTRDINATEGYRSPERSAQLAASGIRAAPAGKSWHNYGAAMDIAIYVNGKYDDGRRGVTEYTGLARQSMQKYGLINDLKGDTGHVYVQSFGKGVPRSVQRKEVDINQYASSKGLSPAVEQPTAVAASTNETAPTTTPGGAIITKEGNTTTIDIRTAQRAARNKAISDALAEGKSSAEAESLGEIAGNRAGRDALRGIT